MYRIIIRYEQFRCEQIKVTDDRIGNESIGFENALHCHRRYISLTKSDGQQPNKGHRNSDNFGQLERLTKTNNSKRDAQ